MSDRYGYLFAHFVEDPDGHGEKLYLTRSIGDDPTRWERLNAGQPVLESTIGTTGMRDPFVVRTDHGFTMLATDLRIYGGDDAGWDAWTRRGSRSLVIAESTDLRTWSTPRLAEVAPPEAGMAWAPEVIRLPGSADYHVYWSSTLFDPEDRNHEGDSYSRILISRTRDFHTFSPPTVLVDAGRPVIDMSAIVHEGRIHRFLKEEDSRPDSRLLYHETGTDFFADDFRLLAERIGDDMYSKVEAPIAFRDNHRQIWYLLIDQYERRPQGYFGFWTDDLNSGRWTPFDADEFVLPVATKHGTVLSLSRDEWTALGALAGEDYAE